MEGSALAGLRNNRQDPFIDLLFNALLGFTYLFLVAIMFMNPEAKSGIIDPKAEYIVTVSWPDHNPNDIDTWVEDPEGRLVWFRSPQAGLIHLDRDDRGNINDTITVNGREIVNPLNQEVVTIRGTVTGEYVVNVQYYASENGEPVDVTVKIEKVNPRLDVVYYDTVTLHQEGDEKTVARFRIGADGDVTDINTIPKLLATQ